MSVSARMSLGKQVHSMPSPEYLTHLNLTHKSQSLLLLEGATRKQQIGKRRQGRNTTSSLLYSVNMTAH